MRILFLACFGHGDLKYGGAEKSIIYLANYIACNTQNEVIIASVDGANQPYHIDQKVLFDYEDCYEHSKIKQHIRIAKNVRKIFSRYNPDIVVSFWIQPLFYLFGKRAKFIYSERNDPKLDYSVIAKIMRRFVLNKANQIVFQTNEAKKYFSKKIQIKSKVIHNPVYISYDQYPVYTDDKNRIVAVGRLNKQKNYPLLISAFSDLHKKFPNYTLEIYGDGILKSELNELIAKFNLTDYVKLMGADKDVISKIYGAKLFIMTSSYEGMPNALMEAMCLGIPVLCSNCPCGGPKELIDDGINGFLFKNNDIDDLINKASLILGNQIDIEKMPIEEKKICITHSQESIFGEWIKFIGL